MRSVFTLGLIFAFLQTIAADTTRFVVLMSGKHAGYQNRWSDAPHHFGYEFEYNDRGRGPKVNVEVKTDNDGIVIERIVTGHDYFKAPINETFTLTAGTARWMNHMEKGEKSVSGKVLYSAINGAPAEIELDIKAVQKVTGHQLDVVPSGKFKATHLKNHSTKLDGLVIELELYSITGAGGPPSYVWVNPHKEFFASLSPWLSVILADHEDLVPELMQLQDDLEEEYYYQQATKLTEKPTEAVAIKNVAVFDPVKGTSTPGQTVIFEKGVITMIGKAKKVKVPPTATIIDGAGKMLLPGLWDNHAHYGKSDGLYHLAGGVTNIRDMGNSLDLPETRKKVDEDQLLGPEISIMSGFIDFAGPYAGPTGKIVSTLDEALEGVKYYADHGYDQVKLYSSLPVDWVKPIADRAHQLNLKVCGHIPSFMTAERAVKDGYDQIIHMNMVMLNFLGDTLDTRSMGRFTKVAARSKDIDMNGPAVKQFIGLLKEKNVGVDPTMAIFESMFTNEPGKLAKGYESIVSWFPANYSRSLYYGGLPTMKGNEKSYQQSYTNMLTMLKMLHQAGITILPGTDDAAGFALHRELELYSLAGISNQEVLRMATYNSAKAAGKEKELGTIEVGKRANLVMVEGNPIKNISDIRKVDLTVKNGRIYDPKAMYQSYGFGFWKP